MTIVIAGGTGQVGTLLARAFTTGGRDVVVLSRTTDDQRHPWRVVPWDARTLGAWTEVIDGSEAVINLTGRSVNCRYIWRFSIEVATAWERALDNA
ncbi:MAG: NAD-dependent epimerase/dehydratase family protein, partial [bacterium]